VPVAAQTAWEGIFTHGHLEKGQTTLIHGGAGAVGAYAVQLASRAGATVIATASGNDEAYLNSLGASRVLDYRKTQFETALQEKVDVVFDLVGGGTQKRSFLVLKEGGHLLSATQPVSQEETVKLSGRARQKLHDCSMPDENKRKANSAVMRTVLNRRSAQ
jgi:NADPH:quinone reductase-like Zn-dependent oxidoreductase